MGFIKTVAKIRVSGCWFPGTRDNREFPELRSEFPVVKGINQKLALPLPPLQKAGNKTNVTMSNRTFTMIKPDAFIGGHTGAILDRIIQEGYRIKALKMIKLAPEKAGEFYAIHKERPFYNELVTFMSSGPIVAAILEKDNAVEDFRKLIGATDPAKAAAGTIRKLYATSLGENAIHGSDSDENARIEGDFMFSMLEQF